MSVLLGSTLAHLCMNQTQSFACRQSMPGRGSRSGLRRWAGYGPVALLGMQLGQLTPLLPSRRTSISGNPIPFLHSRIFSGTSDVLDLPSPWICHVAPSWGSPHFVPSPTIPRSPCCTSLPAPNPLSIDDQVTVRVCGGGALRVGVRTRPRLPAVATCPSLDAPHPFRGFVDSDRNGDPQRNPNPIRTRTPIPFEPEPEPHSNPNPNPDPFRTVRGASSTHVPPRPSSPDRRPSYASIDHVPWRNASPRPRWLGRFRDAIDSSSPPPHVRHSFEMDTNALHRRRRW